MNKIYNTWIFILSILCLPFAFLVGLNLELGAFGLQENEAFYDYKTIVFGIVAFLIFLLGMSRSARKWNGMKVINQQKRFQLNSSISKERKQRVALLNVLEMGGFLLLALIFVLFSKDATIISAVFLIMIIDSMMNMMLGLGGKKYRVGMTKKALVSTDREVKVIYFKGLKRVVYQDRILFFEYINDLVLDFPLEIISPKDREQYISLIKENADINKVYFSGF